MPDQALLLAPRRPRTRHWALAHQHRGGPGIDAGAARPALRPLPADLRARYSGRPRQVADRAGLSSRVRYQRHGALRSRGFQWPLARLSAGAIVRRALRFDRLRSSVVHAATSFPARGRRGAGLTMRIFLRRPRSAAVQLPSIIMRAETLAGILPQTGTS